MLVVGQITIRTNQGQEEWKEGVRSGAVAGFVDSDELSSYSCPVLPLFYPVRSSQSELSYSVYLRQTHCSSLPLQPITPHHTAQYSALQYSTLQCGELYISTFTPLMLSFYNKPLSFSFLQAIYQIFFCFCLMSSKLTQ